MDAERLINLIDIETLDRLNKASSISEARRILKGLRAKKEWKSVNINECIVEADVNESLNKKKKSCISYLCRKIKLWLRKVR